MAMHMNKMISVISVISWATSMSNRHQDIFFHLKRSVKFSPLCKNDPSWSDTMCQKQAHSLSTCVSHLMWYPRMNHLIPLVASDTSYLKTILPYPQFFAHGLFQCLGLEDRAIPDHTRVNHGADHQHGSDHPPELQLLFPTQKMWITWSLDNFICWWVAVSVPWIIVWVIVILKCFFLNYWSFDDAHNDQ